MNSFLRWCPGALGLWLRQKFYPRLFAECGKKVVFGRNLNLKQPKKIRIGNNVAIADDVTLDAGNIAGSTPILSIGDDVYLGAKTVLQADPASIIIDRGSSLSSHCLVHAILPVYIGEKVLSSAYVTIGKVVENRADLLKSTETRVDSGCWLGARAVISQGVSIGEGSIVGAHGIVYQDLPPRVVAVGQPVKIVAERKMSSVKSNK